MGLSLSDFPLLSTPKPSPPPFTLPPLYAFSYAPALLLFCILLQPSIPAHISTYGRRALILPTLLFVALAPYRWRLGPAEWAVAFNFRLSIFGPDLILKALEWGLMDEKDRATKLSWVGFDADDDKESELKKVVEKKNEDSVVKKSEDTVEKKGGATSPAEGSSTAIPADVLKARLRTLTVEPDELSSSPNSSLSSSPPGVANVNLVAGQLPTPLTSSPTSPQTSPPPTPIDPISAANPPPLHLTDSSTLSKPQVRSRAATITAIVQDRHPMRVLIDACHFLSAMRGLGYGFGPAPPRKKSQQRYQSLPVKVFLRHQLRDFVRSQVTSTACMGFQVLHRDRRILPFLARHIPRLSSSPSALSATNHIINTIAYLTVGVSLYAQMIIGYSGAALGIVLVSLLVNSLLDRFSTDIKWRWSFESREYTPLFDKPFAKMGEGGVAGFWGKRWHALFKSPFTSLGFSPTMKISRRLGLPKAAAKFLAVYCVFFLSAWMHVQAFASARYNIVPSPAGQLYATSLGIPLSSLTPRPSAELSFREAYGTWIFFLSQPIAIALETVFLSGKKKRIGGMSGRIWVTLWVGGIGAWAVGRSWLALGLAHGVPPVEMWSWHRYVIPTAHLLPMPVFMKV